MSSGLPVGPPAGSAVNRATATSPATTLRSTFTTWTPPSTTCAPREFRVLGQPMASRNVSAGQRWIYFLALWGMQFELVSFPHGKAYEKDAPVLLWNPVHPAE
jgi:hypothetical protein